jgi:hypothetical protein
MTTNQCFSDSNYDFCASEVSPENSLCCESAKATNRELKEVVNHFGLDGEESAVGLWLVPQPGQGLNDFEKCVDSIVDAVAASISNDFSGLLWYFREFSLEKGVVVRPMALFTKVPEGWGREEFIDHLDGAVQELNDLSLKWCASRIDVDSGGKPRHSESPERSVPSGDLVVTGVSVERREGAIVKRWGGSGDRFQFKLEADAAYPLEAIDHED